MALLMHAFADARVAAGQTHCRVAWHMGHQLAAVARSCLNTRMAPGVDYPLQVDPAGVFLAAFAAARAAHGAAVAAGAAGDDVAEAALAAALLAAAPLLEPLGGLAAAALPQLPPLRCRDAWLLEDEAEPPAAPQARRRTRPSAPRAPDDVHAALDAWELFLARVYMRLHSRALGLPVPVAWQPRHVIYALGAGWASADMRLAFDTGRVSYMVRFWGRDGDAAGMSARELAAFVGAPDPSVPVAPTVLANGAFMDRHFHGQEQHQRLVF